MSKILTLTIIIFSLNLAQAQSDRIQYKTIMGSCPNKSSTEFSLLLIEKFSENRDLYQLKKLIIKEKLDSKYFLSFYEIKYDPLQKFLKINLDCSKPILKVHITRKTGENFYTSLLTEDGKLLDPNYEVVLKSEKMLKEKLPSLVVPISFIDDNKISNFVSIVEKMPSTMKNEISEMVVNSDLEFTIIMSIKNRATTVFMGTSMWDEKIEKLIQMIGYMKEENKIPTVINMLNIKKIVVKF